MAQVLEPKFRVPAMCKKKLSHNYQLNQRQVLHFTTRFKYQLKLDNKALSLVQMNTCNIQNFWCSFDVELFKRLGTISTILVVLQNCLEMFKGQSGSLSHFCSELKCVFTHLSCVETFKKYNTSWILESSANNVRLTKYARWARKHATMTIKICQIPLHIHLSFK